MTASKQLDIAQWLTDLAVRCTPRTSENIEVMARDYANGLDDLPAEAFTPQSREAATRHFEHFPAYKPLRAWLEKWWSAHKPTRPLLPPVNDPNLSDEDRSHVRSWINLRNGEGDLGNRLSTFRDKWPRAFAYIVRTDDQAAAIAKGRGWIEDNAPIDVTERGIAGNLVKLEKLAGEGSVGAALASMGLSILRKNLSDRAPERSGLLPERMVAPSKEPYRTVAQQRAAMGDPPTPPTISEQQEAAFVAEHGRRPGQMTPEQLATVRNAAGIKLPKPANDPAPLEGEIIPPDPAADARHLPWED
jgi:hypothetical protein